MHTIRLRGPWQVEPVERLFFSRMGIVRKRVIFRPGSATMPADWSEFFGADFLGRVVYRRSFQKPTGLDSGERVCASGRTAAIRARVSCGKAMSCDFVPPGERVGRFEITDRLEDHNELEIIVDHPDLSDASCEGAIGETPFATWRIGGGSAAGDRGLNFATEDTESMRDER